MPQFYGARRRYPLRRKRRPYATFARSAPVQKKTTTSPQASGISFKGRKQLLGSLQRPLLAGGRRHRMGRRHGGPTHSHIATKDGISDVTTLKMTWTNTNVGLPFATYYWLANTIIDPDLSFATTNFQYTKQWAGFYNYYQVDASRFKVVVTNQDQQDKILVVFPTIYPPGSGNVPATLDAALQFPHSKHCYVGQPASGRPISRLTHYVDVGKFMANQVPYFPPGGGGAMPSRAGRLPSSLFAGVGTQPTAQLWWVMQIYPTNDTLTGTYQADYNFELTDYVKMFGTVLGSDITLLNEVPEWKTDHPDPLTLADPLDPYFGEDPPDSVSRFQKIETKKYFDALMKEQPPLEPKDPTDPPPPSPTLKTLSEAESEDEKDLTKSQIVKAVKTALRTKKSKN